MVGKISKEVFGLYCGWCGKEKATIGIYGVDHQSALRLCLSCSADIIETITAEVKVQRLRHLIDTGEGVVLKRKEERNSD